MSRPSGHPGALSPSSGSVPSATSDPTHTARPSSPGRPPAPPSSSSSSSSSKRTRLTLACNQCRKRKVRCDTETPKCRNCWLRDEVCEATDPRWPHGTPTVRRWATKDGLLPGQNPAATHRNQAWVPKHGPIAPTTAVRSSISLGRDGDGDGDENEDDRAGYVSQDGGRDWNIETHHDLQSSSASVPAMTAASSLQRGTPSGSTTGSVDSPADTVAMSWVSRGYQDSINAGGGWQCYQSRFGHQH